MVTAPPWFLSRPARGFPICCRSSLELPDLSLRGSFCLPAVCRGAASKRVVGFQCAQGQCQGNDEEQEGWISCVDLVFRFVIEVAAPAYISVLSSSISIHALLSLGWLHLMRPYADHMCS